MSKMDWFVLNYWLFLLYVSARWQNEALTQELAVLQAKVEETLSPNRSK